ncbi:hypothetical protein N5P37_006112 [Trichoderma harzianum]|uniref:RBR-type E3 ubiquitin transferase n=1 Tax=Trichoderma harzianum CBS 226.95 TaxID=983964 RepID=A0A2T4AAC6_TRIHA|nr:hypothetical protein M431DRAFT_87514 [Trichoderma harzianum CBS 226.95]KAK0761166.1 hypothetical protein N5P37_006112 [Trichoderma harzianum]PKK48131.1 hypothetical protein CI102_9165 [Trichoderma harzianum]PTB54044.1 hypothetical protein M431DRAFT_87514 [Trichoderma harzianum CBS 226.95]
MDDLDQETLKVIIEIQLREAQDLVKGKHREGEQPDTELAMQLYCQELESLATACSDQAMSRSIAHAVLIDGDIIRNHLEEEQQAVRDREFAMNRQPSAAAASTAPPETVIEDEMIEKLAALYIGIDDDQYSTVGEPSSRRVEKSSSTIETRRCLACMADVPFFETIQCPCSHEYCRECIAKLFNAAIGDESLFPPRCCGQPIPLGINQIFLPAELVGEYRAKELEYGTPNRTYCHQPACSAFIPSQFIQGDVATCIKCRSETCTICKGQSHDDHCPEDAATLEVLRIAKENGWQRCYSCHRLVDLSTGCNHITCRCGAQFCYVCGAQWKTCRCDQWDENRLIDRANVLVDRDADGQQLGGARRAALVQRARNHLVRNHQCTHRNWTSRRGAFRCDECHEQMPDYIFECQNCSIHACRRCRFNRL